MSNHITVTGNAGRDAELKHTPSGATVLELAIADTPRRKTDNGWEDAGPTNWYRGSLWGPQAEALYNAGTITKGTQVTFTGTLTPREYEKDGVTRTSLDVRIDTIGVREKRDVGQERPTKQTAARADDPWATAGPASSGTFADEPPF